jgi:hypothetical protein
MTLPPLVRVTPKKSSKDNPGKGADLMHVTQKEAQNRGEINANGSADPKSLS